MTKAELVAENERLRRKLKKALKAVQFLDCLYAAGVDGWSGYEVAQDMYAQDTIVDDEEDDDD